MPPKMMTLGDMKKEGESSSSGVGGDGDGNEYYTGGAGPRGGK